MRHNDKVHAITIDIKATFSILRSSAWRIIAFLIVATITVVLVYYYPALKEREGRLLFTVTLVWPSGIVIVLVPIIVELVREVNENKAAFICYHLTKEVHRLFSHNPNTQEIFKDRIRVNDELRSKDKAKRNKALKILVDEINAELQK